MTSRWDILTGDAERDQRNVRIVLESVAELYGPRKVDELLARAVDRAITVAGAERGLLFLEGRGGDGTGPLELVVARGHGGVALGLDQRSSRTVVDEVWRSDEASLTMDADGEQPASLSDSILSLRLLSIMAVPLPVKAGSIGVLYVDSTAKVKEFTRADFSVFQALGGLIALAVENARLLAEEAERARMKRELIVAQQIQQQLLPRDLPTPAGFELAAVGRPCEETSGDYYDVVPLRGESLALVVGDVSGHGLGPALVMASTRALLRSLLQTDPDPRVVIERLNAYLERDTPDDSFVSMFLGILDPNTSTMHYVSAGHNPPFLLRASGEIVDLQRTGPLLGIMERAAFQVSDPVILHPGDALLCYTDGLFEAARGDGELYGEARLRRSLTMRAAAHPAAQTLVNGLLEDLDTFVAGTRLEDDVTLLVVRAT